MVRVRKRTSPRFENSLLSLPPAPHLDSTMIILLVLLFASVVFVYFLSPLGPLSRRAEFCSTIWWQGYMLCSLADLVFRQSCGVHL